MLDFESVTILYGGNGSGKTTVLNVIAEKLGLERDTLYNRSNFFEDYTYCERGDEIGEGHEIYIAVVTQTNLLTLLKYISLT